MNKTKMQMPELDGWRGLAISMVLFAHFIVANRLLGSVGNLFDWTGTFGVQLFFALSGSLIGAQLFSPNLCFRRFFIRRFSRVYPAFFIFTVSLLFASRFLWERYDVPFTELLATLTFMRTYFPHEVTIWHASWPIGHFWSLNVEEHSYVWLALGAFLAIKIKSKNLPKIFLLVSFLASLCFIAYYKRFSPSESSTWSLYSQCAAVGLLFSAFYRLSIKEYVEYFSFRRIVSPLALLLSIGVSVPLGLVHSETLAALFLGISVNHMQGAATLYRKFFSTKILTVMGTCSFSLYLWQQPFYLSAKVDGNSFFYFFLALLSGFGSYYLIENPIRTYINNRYDDFLKSSRSVISDAVAARDD